MSKVTGSTEEKLKAALAAGSNDTAQGSALKVHDFFDLLRTEMQILADNEPNEKYRSRYLKHLDKLNIKVKKTVEIDGDKAYVCYGHATKCFGKQPTPGEAADLAFAISQIDPDSIYGYLTVGGFMEMYHQTEKEPKGMLFAHPLVDATQVHIPERWVEPCLFIPEELK